MGVADIFQIQNNIVHYQGYAHHWKTGMIYFLIPTCTCEWVFSFRILIFAQKCITNTLYFIHHDGAKYRDETNLTLDTHWNLIVTCIPRSQSSLGQHGAHLGPVGPRWAPCWPHEPCYQGCSAFICHSCRSVLNHLGFCLGFCADTISRIICRALDDTDLTWNSFHWIIAA